MYDVLVIGSGPAGMAAALAASERGLAVAVASCKGSTLCRETLPCDLYGITAASGEELYQAGIRQAKQAGICLLEQEITGLTKLPGGFYAIGDQPLEAAAVILATGKPSPQPLPSFVADASRVHLRAEEHDFVYRHRMVGVVGCGPFAFRQAELLSRHARAVTLFTNGNDLFRGPAHLSINRYAIRSFGANNQPNTLIFENDAKLNIDGLFLADRVADAADLCAGVGVACPEGHPICSSEGATVLPGLYATGECVGMPFDLHQLLYHGHTVGCAVSKYVNNNTI